jgi:hypothetical protein
MCQTQGELNKKQQSTRYDAYTEYPESNASLTELEREKEVRANLRRDGQASPPAKWSKPVI